MSGSASIIQGQDFVRFYRNVNSNIPITAGIDAGVGSAIEVDVAIKSLHVGPRSGFDRYKVYYYDPTQNLAVEAGEFAVGAPWVAQLNAFPSDIIDPLNQEGKLYIVPENQFNASIYSSVGGGSEVIVFPPTIDVFGYFSDRVWASPKRSPLLIDTAVPIPGGAAFGVYFFPFFGRKHADFMVYGVNAASGPPDWSIGGLRFGGFENAQTVTLLTTAVLSTGVNSFTYESTRDAGYYEYLILTFSSGNTVNPEDGDPVRVWYEARD